MTSTEPRPIVVGISGASGSVLAKETVDALLRRRVPVLCTASNAARQVWSEEMDEPFRSVLGEWQEDPNFTYYGAGDMRAPIASGTVPTGGMVIVPCSVATVAAVAHGFTTNLLQRAADVCLKERRRLVVVPRETPLSAIHLENMTRLAQLGVTVLSPEPAFYLRPRTIEDVVAFIVGRILVALEVAGEMDKHLQYLPKSE